MQLADFGIEPTQLATDENVTDIYMESEEQCLIMRIICCN